MLHVQDMALINPPFPTREECLFACDAPITFQIQFSLTIARSLTRKQKLRDESKNAAKSKVIMRKCPFATDFITRNCRNELTPFTEKTYTYWA